MMKVPRSVIMGKSPMKTSCSLISPVTLLTKVASTKRGARERDVLVAALLLGVLLGTELVLAEVELELFGEILDRADLVEDFLDAFVQELIERLLLDGDEVGKGEDLFELGETDTLTHRNELVRQGLDPSRVVCDARRKARADGTANEQSTHGPQVRQPCANRPLGRAGGQGTPWGGPRQAAERTNRAKSGAIWPAPRASASV